MKALIVIPVTRDRPPNGLGSRLGSRRSQVLAAFVLVAATAALSPAEVGAFYGLDGTSAPALRVISQGAVSITVECLVGWQHSRASLRFTLYADLR